MTLEDDLFADTNARPFKLDGILERLETADRDTVEQALADPSVPSARIARVLTERGHRISENAVRNWREAHGTG